MKKSILFIAAAAMMGACGTPNAYLLTGTVDTTFNGATAYLVYGEKTDSVIVENGAFTFKGVIDTPVMAMVRLQKDKQRTGGRLVLEAGAPVLTIGEETVCSGTPLNVAFNNYNSEMEKLYNAYREGYTAAREKEGATQEEIQATAEQLREVYSAGSKALNDSLFVKNNNNPLGAMAMLGMARDKAQFDSLYMIAGDLVKADPRVMKEKARYTAIENTAEGKMFTDFTIATGSADGTKVSLSDYVGKGKYVLADFWASWCGPCRGEMPNLAEVYKKYKGDKFEIIGIAVWDKRADTQKAMSELPITWPVIFDAETIPTDIYGINGIPQIILFGPDGTIVARDLRGEKIGEKIAECLAAQK